MEEKRVLLDEDWYLIDNNLFANIGLLKKGDYMNVGLSAGAMIPFVGWGATGGKLIGKGMKALNQFNSVESLIDGAGKLTRVKGAQQGL